MAEDSGEVAIDPATPLPGAGASEVSRNTHVAAVPGLQMATRELLRSDVRETGE